MPLQSMPAVLASIEYALLLRTEALHLDDSQSFIQLWKLLDHCQSVDLQKEDMPCEITTDTIDLVNKPLSHKMHARLHSYRLNALHLSV